MLYSLFEAQNKRLTEGIKMILDNGKRDFC